jgi:hypothetical protein
VRKKRALRERGQTKSEKVEDVQGCEKRPGRMWRNVDVFQFALVHVFRKIILPLLTLEEKIFFLNI